MNVVKKIDTDADSDIIPAKSLAIEEVWYEQLHDLYRYLFCTMGDFLQVEIPFSAEANNTADAEIYNQISSLMGIKITRDGYYFLSHYTEIFSSNRIMRALLDTCARFESKFHDSTTTFLIITCALLLYIKNMSVVRAKEFIDSLRIFLKRLLSNNICKSSSDMMKYIFSAISCLDQETKSAVCDIIINAPRGSLSICKNEYPSDTAIQATNHLYVESSDGCMLVTPTITPTKNLNDIQVRVFIINTVFEFENLLRWVTINEHMLCSSNLHHLIICRYYCSVNSNVLSLLDNYRIIMCSIPSLFLDNIECMNVLKKCSGAICCSDDMVVSIDEPVHKIYISTYDKCDIKGKILLIHTPCRELFLPGEIHEYVSGVYKNTNKKTEDTIAINSFIFNLLSMEMKKLTLTGYQSSHDKNLAEQKLYDIISLHSAGMLGVDAEYIPSFFWLLNNLSNEHDDECANVILFLKSISCLAKEISFPLLDSQHCGCYVDLYASVSAAIEWACNFAFDIKRTIFVQK